MNKPISTLIGLMMIVMAAVDGLAQVAPPELRINLVVSELKYLLNDPNDPIEIELTLEASGGPIITRKGPKGFLGKPFHLFLVFTGPDGKPINAQSQGTEGVGLVNARTLLVNGELILVDEVETLAADFLLPVNIPDCRAFYSLDKVGDYSVIAKIVMRTFPGVDFTVGGIDFARLDSSNFTAVRESNRAKFSIRADADMDGFFSDVDCDDTNPAVNPGAQEIAGNGIDDDCNPATIEDVVSVSIDIKPDSESNNIHLGVKASLAVAIFSTNTFDATTVDPVSVTLANAPVQVKKKGKPSAVFEDIDEDGLLDLVVKVSVNDLQISNTATEAILEGNTFTGQLPFFHIRGVDSVTIVP